MARHPEPRRRQLDVADVLLLTHDEYEHRRQAGAHASRVQSLSQRLAAVTAFLGELGQAVARRRLRTLFSVICGLRREAGDFA